jgi:hypothetical protein
MDPPTDRRIRDRHTLPAGAIVVADGTVWRVLADGSTEEVLPGGHPRPGCAHATATRRTP